MSVINKMLQDLDARQNGAPEASHLYTKPASAGERRVSPLLLGGAAAGVMAVAFGAAFGWRYWHQEHPPAAAAAPAPAKVVIAPAPPRITPLQAAPAAPVPATAAAAPVVREAPAPVKAADPVVEQAKPIAPKRAKDADKHDAGKQHVERDRREQKAAPAPKAKPAAPAAVQAEKSSAQGKEETAAQKAEALYRRGLENIKDGYLSDGIAALEQALQANANHEAARQTLVRVLIDNKRTEEAMRHLQTGLTLEPRQPSMAMLLARLQIEHGGSGIDALMRTLPYAGSNSEYRAFLAGALQRQQRHREAAEQYQLALRGAPQNGVWLMGLGISLQAEKRDAEALDAFRKAKNSGMLSAELQAFVDGKIQQLAR